MTANPDLRVFVANGYYDLATPYAATQYTVNHLGSDRKLLDRVTMAYYEGGHMMYVHKPSLVKLRKDAAAFLTTNSSVSQVLFACFGQRILEAFQAAALDSRLARLLSLQKAVSNKA